MDLALIKHSCIGLDVYSAKNKIKSLYPEILENQIDITYKESDSPRFVVFDCKIINDQVMLFATSKNPIRNLPSIYQENDFLRSFLMIFQHLSNDIAIKIDNLNELFRPMHCTADFLQVLADWFGIDIDLLSSEESKRLFLQCAIPLFKTRGTIKGLKTLIYIVTGLVPEIIEDYIPYSFLEISDGVSINTNIFERKKDISVFTISFPLYREEFDSNLLRRLTILLQKEKPVNTEFFFCFKQKEIRKKKRQTITEKTDIGNKYEF